MVLWLQENFGEAQSWEAKVLEPEHLKKSYKWAMGQHRVVPHDAKSFSWPCFWIPDGPAHTMFLLRWINDR